ncbi:MAG: hypothetical protein A3J55_00680 [Candidatus Ryanbacteria bacterium RIFCSPHIGHO2_02_FULL_45_17b]|uniref:Carbonic anhydrase n=1 Tax=Candidatus Ryanbacteria bacterium RIFCSPHIGHO2_01_FULL_45_22 TaxID=1802114 RepID=A0A1G2G0T0_9BACT|nr:MAG: hypothetical protein A2719_03145 [Candidatus Ryanbacteria bacterium RIFCSPHIGHO2_01_FULL_45_22]OGZ47058.1 MAG: hypothetical protein A3J55_00680 [Candidatus Ryanbacteria bacterium RIFCSPHIGHO2_02_FULL_45_17b]
MNPDASLIKFNKAEFLSGKQIIALETAKDHYHADAAVVWCFDDRFSSALSVFLETKQIKRKDLVCIAGGLKTLASPDNENDRTFVLGQILASIALHHTPTVYLMVHSDCGKYGGLQTFGNDENAELRHYQLEAKRAVDFLTANLEASIKIEPVFVDFTGVWKI